MIVCKVPLAIEKLKLTSVQIWDIVKKKIHAVTEKNPDIDFKRMI